jgi:hypothetical protein
MANDGLRREGDIQVAGMSGQPIYVHPGADGTAVIVDGPTVGFTALTTGTVTSVTASAPLSATTGSSPVISLLPVTFSRQTSTNYTLVLGDIDDNHWVEMNNAGANTLTVPSSATVNAMVGRSVRFSQYGAGATTLTAATTGVLIRTALNLSTTSQYMVRNLTKVGADEWYAF